MSRACSPPPHIGLALLRLVALSRSIRSGLSPGADAPECRGRAWASLRPALPAELETAIAGALDALQRFHEGVFRREGFVAVRDVQAHVSALADAIARVLALHRETAAALSSDDPVRGALLEIIAEPLLQLAEFFEAMRRAIDRPRSETASESDDVELRLSIRLDFADRIDALGPAA